VPGPEIRPSLSKKEKKKARGGKRKAGAGKGSANRTDRLRRGGDKMSGYRLARTWRNTKKNCKPTAEGKKGTTDGAGGN